MAKWFQRFAVELKRGKIAADKVAAAGKFVAAISNQPFGFFIMNKIMPYIKLFGSVVLVLAFYKTFIQPSLPASATKYFPAV